MRDCNFNRQLKRAHAHARPKSRSASPRPAPTHPLSPVSLPRPRPCSCADACSKHVYSPPPVPRPRGAPCQGAEYTDFLGRWRCSEAEWREPCRCGTRSSTHPVLPRPTHSARAALMPVGSLRRQVQRFAPAFSRGLCLPPLQGRLRRIQRQRNVLAGLPPLASGLPRGILRVTPCGLQRGAPRPVQRRPAILLQPDREVGGWVGGV